MSDNGENYQVDLSHIYFIDTEDNGHQLHTMEAATIPPNPTSWITQTCLTWPVVTLDQPLLTPQADEGDLSVSTMSEVTLDQSLLTPQAERGDLSVSTMSEVTLDQPLLTLQAERDDLSVSTMSEVTLDQSLLTPQAEEGVQLPVSSQTSRGKAVPGTSYERRGRKRKNEKEGNKKVPKYLQDETNPNLTREERESIKNSKNAKKNRDKTEKKIQELQQRVDDVEEENNQLVKDKKHLIEESNEQMKQNNQMMKDISNLRSKIRRQNQLIMWYQRKDEEMRKLANSSPDSGMLQ